MKFPFASDVNDMVKTWTSGDSEYDEVHAVLDNWKWWDSSQKLTTGAKQLAGTGVAQMQPEKIALGMVLGASASFTEGKLDKAQQQIVRARSVAHNSGDAALESEMGELEKTLQESVDSIPADIAKVDWNAAWYLSGLEEGEVASAGFWRLLLDKAEFLRNQNKHRETIQLVDALNEHRIVKDDEGMESYVRLNQLASQSLATVGQIDRANQRLLNTLKFAYVDKEGNYAPRTGALGHNIELLSEAVAFVDALGLKDQIGFLEYVSKVAKSKDKPYYFARSQRLLAQKLGAKEMYSEAFETAVSAREAAEKSDNMVELSLSSLILSHLYELAGDLPRAELEVLQIVEPLIDNHFVANATGAEQYAMAQMCERLARIYAGAGQFDRACTYFNITASLHESLGDEQAAAKFKQLAEANTPR